MKNRKSFMAGFLSGMVPPPFEPSQLPTDVSRIRGDVERVGKQFYSVIQREREKAQRSDRPQANSDADAE